jgi:hypothetical protein
MVGILFDFNKCKYREQTLDEVHIYIEPPEFLMPKNKEKFKKTLAPGEKLPELDIKITASHLNVGLKGLPPFLNEDLGGPVKPSESYWMIEDDELHIQLQKMHKADTWSQACKGH